MTAKRKYTLNVEDHDKFDLLTITEKTTGKVNRYQFNHTQAIEPELKACPDCGSNDIDPEGWVSAQDAGPQCNNCGARAFSVADWNS